MAAPMKCGAKLTKQERQQLKKENKAKFTLFRHEQIETSDLPTCHLVVGNGGLGNNIQYEQLFQLFSPHGHLVDIVMKPRKPYAFVSFETVQEAEAAFTAVHGETLVDETLRVGDAHEVKLYLAFVKDVPAQEVDAGASWPDGLHVLENFVSEEMETMLLNCIQWGQPDKYLATDGKQTLKHRRVKHCGFEFCYDTNNVDKARPLEWGIPSECNQVLDDIMKTGHVAHRPDQLTVNEYQPGQGIPPHVDTHSAFEDEIISLGLGSQVVMEFRHPDGHHVPVLVPRRALVIMTGESRYLWSHGITPRKSDLVPVRSRISMSTPNVTGRRDCEGLQSSSNTSMSEDNTAGSKSLTLLTRATRTSFTFRKIRVGDCQCKYPGQCDTQMKQKQETPVAESPSVPHSSDEAADLEHMHVHQVYEEIADHFSATRHSPWPRVEEFLQGLPPGSLVADIGCGNGKYMVNQPHLCMMGSDRSLKLCEICAERHLQVFVCDILSVPIREGVFDAAICIAVVHHLSTPERRLAAIQQITKVLRPGGQALIYVWALEQERQKVKSNYLSDFRIKNKVSADGNSDSGQDQDVCHPESKTTTTKTLERHELVQKEDGNPESSSHDGKQGSQQKSLSLHVNRTHFDSQDLLVPWHLKTKSSSQASAQSGAPSVFHRYYHVFQEGELENLALKAGEVTVQKSYYDKGNWCAILKKEDTCR